MVRLINGLQDRFDLTAVDEWTVEINPATADGNYLTQLRRIGVDRLSFGAQSFDPAELRTLERHHAPADVEHGLALARDAGFPRTNLDLIYAIPGQTMPTSWRTLARPRPWRSGTTHLSCYGLTYEPNTVIAVRQRLGRLTAVEDDAELAMLHRHPPRAGRRRSGSVRNQQLRRPGAGVPAQPGVLDGPATTSASARVRRPTSPGTGSRTASTWATGNRRFRPAVCPSSSTSVLSDAERVEERSDARTATRPRRAMARLYRSTCVTIYADAAGRTGPASALIDFDAAGFRLTERGIDVADGVAGQFV